MSSAKLNGMIASSLKSTHVVCRKTRIRCNTSGKDQLVASQSIKHSLLIANRAAKDLPTIPVALDSCHLGIQLAEPQEFMLFSISKLSLAR
jgi:hypothetical protein